MLVPKAGHIYVFSYYFGGLHIRMLDIYVCSYYFWACTYTRIALADEAPTVLRALVFEELPSAPHT